jgi:signal transduction histidine kinase
MTKCARAGEAPQGGASKALNLRRLQSLLFLAVAFGAILFTASTLFNELRARTIDSDIEASTTNGLPSTELLNGMAVDAEAADRAALEYRARPEPARLHERISSAQEGLADKLRSFLALPAYPGERILKSDLAEKVHGFQASANAFLASVDAGDGEGTRLAASREMQSWAARLSKSSHRLISVNNDQLTASAERISGARATSVRDGLFLDGIAMLFALGTGAMVVRMIRRYDLLNREHTELMERRTVELEQFGERLVHDLRNPLAAVSMCIDRIKETVGVGSPARVEEIATRADRSLKRALLLMNGIFAFARSAGKLEPGARADVGATVRSIVDELSISKDAERALMIVEPFPELFVACDVGTLTSVLENLLQNALKYTRDCDVRRITVRASRGCGGVRIEIEDTGPGIPPGIVDRIFEPYVRVGGGQQLGLGLGLATVKRFCEACGGSVRVHSILGVGCTFTVELPEATEATEDCTQM